MNIKKVKEEKVPVKSIYVLRSVNFKDYFKGFMETEKAYSTWSYDINHAMQFDNTEEALMTSNRISTSTEVVLVII